MDEPYTERMKIVCQYCKKDMGTKPCVPEMKDGISSSICRECCEKHEPDLYKKLAAEGFWNKTKEV